MSLQFYKLKVAEVIRETPDTISIVLDVPEELRQTFSYKPGQYLTVQVDLGEHKSRRAYSLSSSPHIDEKLKITSKRVDKGAVSNFLNDNTKPGDLLEVLPPMGNFVPALDPGQQKNYIFFSGGSGITPVFSIIKSVLKTEPHSTVTLFYGNRNYESIIFHQELMKMKEKYGDRVTLVHSLDQYSDDWAGYKGMIDRQKAEYLLSTYCKDSWAHGEYYICGPAGMMREVELALENRLVPKSKIHKENFTVSTALPGEETPVVAPGAPATTGGDTLTFPVKAKIILDGKETEIEIKEGRKVLESAIDAGLDPPFACQIGACSTCRAKLKQGKVSMDEREALTDDEIARGYILTCQSHPLTNFLEVDYDG